MLKEESDWELKHSQGTVTLSCSVHVGSLCICCVLSHSLLFSSALLALLYLASAFPEPWGQCPSVASLMAPFYMPLPVNCLIHYLLPQIAQREFDLSHLPFHTRPDDGSQASPWIGCCWVKCPLLVQQLERWSCVTSTATQTAPTAGLYSG